MEEGHENDVGSERDRPAAEPPDDTKSNKSGERIPAAKRFVKRLLNQYGEIWLFAITEGNHSYFTVEKGEQIWKFGLLFSAESKFNRELRRQGGTV